MEEILLLRKKRKRFVNNNKKQLNKENQKNDIENEEQGEDVLDIDNLYREIIPPQELIAEYLIKPSK